VTPEPVRAYLTRAGGIRSVPAHPPFQCDVPSSGGSREKWVSTTSEREKTPTDVDCALYHEIAVQLVEIANSEGG
jgi:hypothetical protein